MRRKHPKYVSTGNFVIRILSFLLPITIFTSFTISHAQQPKKLFRLGYIATVGPCLSVTQSESRTCHKASIDSMFEGSEYPQAGGLISYSGNDTETFRRAVTYRQILKGAKPADLPIEQPTKFELVISLKAAKRIGLTIPPNVLARADRVIK
jgi:hypothetical protein